jgi:hypothetical protein
MNSDIPLVCNMGVFTPDQRETHVLITTKLIQSIQSVQEVENGYEFTFPNNTKFILSIAEFISNERLCCPFIKFTLTVVSISDQLSLSLTGPVGTQEFLREKFNGAFQ